MGGVLNCSGGPIGHAMLRGQRSEFQGARFAARSFVVWRQWPAAKSQGVAAARLGFVETTTCVTAREGHDLVSPKTTAQPMQRAATIAPAKKIFSCIAGEAWIVMEMAAITPMTVKDPTTIAVSSLAINLMTLITGSPS
jgi:hypothetical protein